MTILEAKYNLNSLVLFSYEALSRLLDCPNLYTYTEACLKPIPFKPVYKGFWMYGEEDIKQFIRPSCMVSTEYRGKNFENEKDRFGQTEEELKQNILVRKLQLDFLHEEDGVKGFTDFSSRLTNDKLLSTKVAGYIINDLWDRLLPQIKLYVFLPYMIYFVSFVSYLAFLYDKDEYPNGWTIALLVFCIFVSFTQIYNEIQQIRAEGIGYFAEIGVVWNFFDMTSSFCVILFAFVDITDIHLGNGLYVIGSLGIFCLWMKLFYFMRLFAETSFYIRMILEMFLDIKVILLVFFLGIFAFSNSYFVLNFALKK